MKKTKLRKVSKQSTSQWQNKCDALLTPIVIKRDPRCLLCSNPTQVAHHHVHKSKSSALRYYLDNLINLCHKCHQALHHNESYYASRIVSLKGLDWFHDLEVKKNQLIKVDVIYYQNTYERLSKIPSVSNGLQ